MHERLSKAELDHARRSVSGATSAETSLIPCDRYSRLLEYHFNQAVLQSLPLQQRSLEEDVAFMPPMGACIYAFRYHLLLNICVSAVPAPDKLRPVFAHALLDCPPIRLPE